MIARKYKVEIYYWKHGESPILVQIGGDITEILNKLDEVLEANPKDLNILLFLKLVDKGEPPSQKQLKYAKDLMRKTGITYDLSDMSKKEVSMLIQRLKEAD